MIDEEKRLILIAGLNTSNMYQRLDDAICKEPQGTVFVTLEASSVFSYTSEFQKQQMGGEFINSYLDKAIHPNFVIDSDQPALVFNQKMAWLKRIFNTTDEGLARMSGVGVDRVQLLLTKVLGSVDHTTVYVVKEPELWLDQGAQSRLGHFLCRIPSTGSRIYITTHSDHVLNAIRLSCKKDILDPKLVDILFFDSHVGYGDRANINKDGLLDHWPNGFFDQLDYDLREMLDFHSADSH